MRSHSSALLSPRPSLGLHAFFAAEAREIGRIARHVGAGLAPLARLVAADTSALVAAGFVAAGFGPGLYCLFQMVS